MKFDKTYILKIKGDLQLKGHSEAEGQKAIDELHNSIKELLKEEIEREVSELEIEIQRIIGGGSIK